MTIEALQNPGAQLPLGRPVYVYGIGASGRLCRTVFDALFGSPVAGFIDSTRDATVDGVEVRSLDRFLADWRAKELGDPVVVVCSYAVQTIHACLRDRGFTGTVLDGQTYLLETMGHLILPDVAGLVQHRSHRPRPDAGGGRPTLPRLPEILGHGQEHYHDALRRLAARTDSFRRIPHETLEPNTPRWCNDWLPAVDGMAIYSMIAERRPRWYVEIGSGNSTMFARRAIQDERLPTRIRSIDPFPRADIDAICDEVLRQPFEAVADRAFDGVDAGDVVFIDSSHRAFQGSDVTVFFTQSLPSLPPGLLVGVHDIFIPYDYPDSWESRLYNEQYLLACWLLAGTDRFDIVFPSHYLLDHEDFRGELSRVLDDCAIPSSKRGGCSFWFTLR